jgi:hypothetical protein
MTKKQIKTIIFGEGGFDELQSNNNIIEVEYYTAEELAVLQAEEAKVAQRQAILDRLGLTADEAKLLLG